MCGYGRRGRSFGEVRRGMRENALVSEEIIR